MTQGSSWEIWTAALDDFEGRLRLVRDGLASGTLPTLEPFSPPDVTAIHPDVVERAQRLLSQSMELERLVVQAQTAVKRNLDATGSRRATTPAERPQRRAGRLDLAM